MNRALTGAWAVEVGIVTVRDLSTVKRPPLPSELLSSFAVYGALAVLAIPAPKVAVATGWGLVVATFLSSQIDFLGPLGDFMSGRIGANKSGGTANLPHPGPGDPGLGGPTTPAPPPPGHLGGL